MLQGIKCLIIDDEPKAIELLKQRLNILFPELVVAGSFTEWEKGLELVHKSPPDILFLDISMPQKSGFDFLKLIPKINFQVIFITAHSNFALDAIKFSVSGYVLKPIDDMELAFAVKKAVEKIRNPQGQQEEHNNFSTLKIGIPGKNGIDYIKFEDILYFESVNKCTKVVTKTHSAVSSYNLGEFKKLVGEKDFLQVHRGFVINLNHVRRYEATGNVIMDDNKEIPISKNVRTDFLTLFNRIARTVGPKSKDTE